jgi:hypothetical protein
MKEVVEHITRGVNLFPVCCVEAFKQHNQVQGAENIYKTKWIIIVIIYAEGSGAHHTWRQSVSGLLC